jgi:hypothetical protein
MTVYGSMVDISCNEYPFRNSHILYTTHNPLTSLVDKYHNGTVLDIYINTEVTYRAHLKEALKYLFRE